MRRHLAPAALLLALAAAVAGCAGPSAPPVVSIDGPATVTTATDAPVRLTGSGVDPSGAPVDLAWDLGDGTSVPGAPTVEHRYAEPGLYRIVLSGSANGVDATPAEVSVRVEEPAAPADPAGPGTSAPGGAPATAEDATAGNGALRFGGTGRDDVDRVKILIDDPGGARSFAADVGATDVTIEFWLRTGPGENGAGPVACGSADAWINGNLVLDRDRYNQGRKFGLSIAGGQVVFGLTGADGTAVSLCGTTRVDDDRWHHVAVTRTVADGAIALFVDGTPQASVAGPAGDVSYPDRAVPRSECGGRPCTGSDPYLVIAAEKHDAGPAYPSFAGLVDELRLSTVVRYPGAFTPPTARFAPDAATAALYHFDEGSGTVLGDSAGTAAPSDGVLQVGGVTGGPLWVPSDAPTG